MVVGNKDPKPLKCPDCGENATGKFVEDIFWCKEKSVAVKADTCETCPIRFNCEDAIPAYECVCGCIFNDEGTKIGERK